MASSNTLVGVHPFCAKLPGLIAGQGVSTPSALVDGLRSVHRALAEMRERGSRGFEEKSRALWLFGELGTLRDGMLCMRASSLDQFAWPERKGEVIFVQLRDFGVVAEYVDAPVDGERLVTLRFADDPAGFAETALRCYVHKLIGRHRSAGIEFFRRMDLNVLCDDQIFDAAGDAARTEWMSPNNTGNLQCAEVTPSSKQVTTARKGALRTNSGTIVLLTVNEHETRAVLDTFVGSSAIPKQTPIAGVTYNELGEHGGISIVHTIAEMGSGGVGSSQQRTLQAIDAWHPAAVVAVGIAFGMDEDKQRMGDVLVSTQIQDYELARVNSNGTLTLRGEKPRASDALYNRLRQSDTAQKRLLADWPKVRFGLVLSGQKLVDNIDYRNSLRALQTEAIGGEMEATGLYVSATMRKTDWIVVKAICDWGHNKSLGDKDALQWSAAQNAVRVLKAAIDLGAPWSAVEHDQSGGF